MSKNKPNFHQDLEFANKHEERIAEYYDGHISEDREYDIIIDGRTIELKIDRYYTTGNFFIEEFSDVDKGVIGGPYRSAMDDVDEFWYVFIENNTFHFYMWKTTDLIEALTLVTGPERKVKNRAWTTTGRLINREKLVEASREVRQDSWSF